MRVAKIFRRGLVVISAALLALQGAYDAYSQFVPYSNPNHGQASYPDQSGNPPYGTPPYGAQPSGAEPYGAQPYGAQPQGNQFPANPPQATQHGAQPGYGQYPATPSANRYQAAVPEPAAQPARGPVPSYRTAMAYQPQEGMTLNQPTESIAPMPETQDKYSAPAAADCQNCQSGAAAQPHAGGYYQGGYAAGGYGAGGDCFGYNTFQPGCVGYASEGHYGKHGFGRYLGGDGCGRQWFGGAYGLYMERGANDWVPLAFVTSTPGVGYYPTDAEIAFTTAGLNNDYQGGAEIRFGATIGGRRGGYDGGYGCDTCGGHGCQACCCAPRFAWEVAYWGLQEDTAMVRVDDMFGDMERTYGMIDYRGLEVDMGGGYRPVNDYFDYGPPTEDHTNRPGYIGMDVEIRSLVARNTFSAQNLEVNLLRLPLCGGGFVCSSCDTCDAGCDTDYYGGRRLAKHSNQFAYCGPRCSLTGVCGVRFVRFDEDFSLRSNYDVVDTGTNMVTDSGFLTHNVSVDNQMVGFQMGTNGIYRLGCTGRFALHLNSTAGIFGNHMRMRQRFDLPTGGNDLRYANGTQDSFMVDTNETDVAMLAELRAGASYQYSCNWRVYGGWRALGVSGVALTFDQIPTAFITPNQASYIQSNGSIFLHGLQAGVECTY